MDLRYIGFKQTSTRRLYKFDGNMEKGRPAAHYVVSVDLGLFVRNRVNIQEGPSLCAQKLKADLTALYEGEHELINGDLAAYAAECAAADAARKAKHGPRRHRP